MSIGASRPANLKEDNENHKMNEINQEIMKTVHEKWGNLATKYHIAEKQRTICVSKQVMDDRPLIVIYPFHGVHSQHHKKAAKA